MKLFFLLVFLFGCASSDIVYHDLEGGYFNLSWNKNNDPIYETGNNPIALNSPLIYKDRLYVGHNSGKMISYRLSDGRVMWSHDDDSEYHSIPVINGELLIYGTVQGRVYGRNLNDGKLIYSVDLGSSVESQGVLYKGRVLFHLRNHRIICLDAETGKILWGYKRSIPSTTTLQRASTPVVVNGNIYVGFADGYVLSIRIEDGMVLWEQKISYGTKFVDVDMTPLFFNGKLLVGSMAGRLHLLDATSGSMIRQIPITASRVPLKVGKFFITGTVEGELVSFDENLKELRRSKISRYSISSICQWQGKIVVATVGHQLLLVDRDNLKVLDTFDLGSSSSAIFGKLQVQDKHLAFLSSRNRLYIFKHRR